MTRYAELHARTRSVSQLGNVITAMRGVAAARAQQSRQQLENVRHYADFVASAMSQILTITPNPAQAPPYRKGTTAIVLFCAEHGFAGAFSEKILEGAGSDIDDMTVLLIGSRGLRVARARGLTPAWSTQLMSQISNAAILADRISAELSRHLQSGHVNCVEVVYAKPQSTQGFEIVRQQLLPLDYARFANKSAELPPILNLSANVLLERLAGEYLFAQLNEAIVHSYAAENLARLQTMTAARDNIKRRLETLTNDERLARQSEITAEIIELAAGAGGLGLE